MKLPSGAVFMIRKYRGKRPHKYQKVKIQRALEAIDRHDLVPLIMPEDTEKNTNAIEKILDNEGSYENDMMDGNEVISEIVEESKEKPTKLKKCDVVENVRDIEQPRVSPHSDEMQNEHLNETVGVENHQDEE